MCAWGGLRTGYHARSGLDMVVGTVEQPGPVAALYPTVRLCGMCSFPLWLILPVPVVRLHLTTQTTKTEKREVTEGYEGGVQQTLWERSDPLAVNLTYLIKGRQRLHRPDVKLVNKEHP